MYHSLVHRSVLLREAVAALNIRADGVYVDGTFGRGGHARAILAALGSRGRLLALDRDPEAESWAKTHFATDFRFVFERSTFGHLAEVVARYGWFGRIQGVLLDVGVSSPQLDDPSRGFSFGQDGPLDMRMDPTTGISAAQWLASCSEQELSGVIREFGEERFHRRIAKAIVTARQAEPITTTLQLARIVSLAMPVRDRFKHPATRTFQAIRIIINGELLELQAALRQAVQVLGPEGRLAVISFHSLEDRLVKRFLRAEAHGPELPPDLPVVASRKQAATLKLIGRALRPGRDEVRNNPRARAAVLRVAERLT